MLYEKMPDETRVWIYQCSRALKPEEVKSIKCEGTKFAMNWLAHGQPLNAAFEIFHNLFLVFFVDENQATASGCSIDESVHFIKNIERQHELSLLDRNLVAFRTGEGVATCNFDQFMAKVQKGVVSEKTLVFNNSVTNKKDFEAKWEVPLKNSWHYEMLQK